MVWLEVFIIFVDLWLIKKLFPMNWRSRSMEIFPLLKITLFFWFYWLQFSVTHSKFYSIIYLVLAVYRVLSLVAYEYVSSIRAQFTGLVQLARRSEEEETSTAHSLRVCCWVFKAPSCSDLCKPSGSVWVVCPCLCLLRKKDSFFRVTATKLQ